MKTAPARNRGGKSGQTTNADQPPPYRTDPAIAAVVARSRADQGLGRGIEDPEMIARLIAMSRGILSRQGEARP